MPRMGMFYNPRMRVMFLLCDHALALLPPFWSRICGIFMRTGGTGAWNKEGGDGKVDHQVNGALRERENPYE